MLREVIAFFSALDLQKELGEKDERIDSLEERIAELESQEETS